MKKHLQAVIVAVAILIVIAVAGYHYYGFVSQMIYSESVSHLTEIFHQANKTLINDVLDMGVRHERIHLKAVRLE